MNILEKELEDIVYETFVSNRTALLNRGLYLQEGIALRQLNLGSYGIADIVIMKMHKGRSIQKDGSHFISRSILCTVVELKKETINVATLLQALGYCKGIVIMIKSYD
jgi:hypothetical protein